jgi:hypothetical protein
LEVRVRVRVGGRVTDILLTSLKGTMSGPPVRESVCVIESVCVRESMCLRESVCV